MFIVHPKNKNVKEVTANIKKNNFHVYIYFINDVTNSSLLILSFCMYVHIDIIFFMQQAQIFIISH